MGTLRGLPFSAVSPRPISDGAIGFGLESHFARHMVSQTANIPSIPIVQPIGSRPIIKNHIHILNTISVQSSGSYLDVNTSTATLEGHMVWSMDIRVNREIGTPPSLRSLSGNMG